MVIKANNACPLYAVGSYGSNIVPIEQGTRERRAAKRWGREGERKKGNKRKEGYCRFEMSIDSDITLI